MVPAIAAPFCLGSLQQLLYQAGWLLWDLAAKVLRDSPGRFRRPTKSRWSQGDWAMLALLFMRCGEGELGSSLRGGPGESAESWPGQGLSVVPPFTLPDID